MQWEQERLHAFVNFSSTPRGAESLGFNDQLLVKEILDQGQCAPSREFQFLYYRLPPIYFFPQLKDIARHNMNSMRYRLIKKITASLAPKQYGGMATEDSPVRMPHSQLFLFDVYL
jgi:hypothetical protein